MISPISQTANSNIFLKNNNYQKKSSFRGNKLSKILDEKVAKGETREEERRNYNKLLLLISGLALALCCLNFNDLKTSFSKSKNLINKTFKSLKNDNKIPTIENCKSINKDLKQLLERQININKASKDILEQTGINPKQSKRMLLFGSPGTGKSFFAKVYAKSLDAEYMEILYSDINSKWVGETEGNMKKMFEPMIKTANKNPDKQYVVIFNEMDSLVVPPDNLTQSSGTHWVSVLRQRAVFLTYLDIMKEKAPNITIIGTTNISPKNNGLDRAAMSRFQKLIEVPYPDKDCLYEALKMNLEDFKDSKTFITNNDSQLKDLAEKMTSRKFSFRNLEQIVDEAKNMYLDDFIKGSKRDFNIDYLQNCEAKLKLSDGELETLNKTK